MNNQNLERELERIRNKWTKEIEYPPAWVETRCQESAKPFELFLYMLVQKCNKYEVLVKSPPEGWGEYLGGLLASFSGTSVMIGLEFHSKDPVKYNDINGMFSLAKRAQPLLNESSKIIREYGFEFIARLVINRIINVESSKELSGKFGKLLMQYNLGCFKAGIQLGNEFR